MAITPKRLGWVFAPMLALAVASLHAADDRTRTAASGHKATTILGGAWNADNTPIKGANLRLRNVVTGKIEAVTKANEEGQFRFENIEGGSYAVELVTDSARVQAVGHVFTIAPGETVATFVRLGPKNSWTSAFFGNTAASVASTAATEGIAAIKPAGNCQSPPCH